MIDTKVADLTAEDLIRFIFYVIMGWAAGQVLTYLVIQWMRRGRR